MHLFLELVTIVFSATLAVHAVRTRGWAGVSLVLSLLLLGTVRENVVVLRDWLYGFAPLHVPAGRAPLIAAVIWMYSILAAVAWAERTSAARLEERRAGGGLLVRVGVFMVALAGFYEPVLSAFGMARWEVGTRHVAGVPAIALVGYPSLAVAALLVWTAVHRRARTAARRAALLAVAMIALAVAHAWALQWLKTALGW